MAADHDAERQRLAARKRRQIDRTQVAGRDQIDAGGGAPAQHQPAQPDIGPAGRGIAGEVHRPGNVGTTVLAVLEMHGKRGQVHVRSARHHLLHRRLAAADLDQFGLEPQTPQDLGQQLLRGNPEGAGDARAARQHVAHQRKAAGFIEQHRTRIGLERGRDLGEPGHAGAAFQLVICEAVDESAQPKALDRCHDRRRYLFHAHGFLASRIGDQAVLTNPTLASSGSSVTCSTIAACAASIVWACQHGTVITSPTARLSSSAPSIFTRASPLMTE